MNAVAARLAGGKLHLGLIVRLAHAVLAFRLMSPAKVRQAWGLLNMSPRSPLLHLADAIHADAVERGQCRLR
jgi:hypothetical protein